MAETHVFASVFVNSEPQSKFLPDGTAVTSFLGSNRPYYVGKNRPDGYEFEAFGQQAEWIRDNVHKGDVVNLTSTSPIRCRAWERDGEMQTRMTVRIDPSSMQWAAGKKKEEEESGDLPF